MAQSVIQRISDEFSNMTPHGRQEYLRTHAHLVKRGVPRDGRFLCTGAWVPVWLTGDRALTGGWQFQAECQLPHVLGLIWLLTEIFANLSDDQILAINARALQPITRYLGPDYITTTQAILNRMHDIISG